MIFEERVLFEHFQHRVSAKSFGEVFRERRLSNANHALDCHEPEIIGEFGHVYRLLSVCWLLDADRGARIGLSSDASSQSSSSCRAVASNGAGTKTSGSMSQSG